ARRHRGGGRDPPGGGGRGPTPTGGGRALPGADRAPRRAGPRPVQPGGGRDHAGDRGGQHRRWAGRAARDRPGARAAGPLPRPVRRPGHRGAAAPGAVAVGGCGVTVRQRSRRATVGSWQDYFAAAQWLDALCAAPAGRRGTDDARADAASARAELAEVRAELARQRTALAGRGRLDATPAELAAARAEVSTDLASIREALHECRKLILAADALL